MGGGSSSPGRTTNASEPLGRRRLKGRPAQHVDHRGAEAAQRRLDRKSIRIGSKIDPKFGPCPQTLTVTAVWKTILVVVDLKFHHPLLVAGGRVQPKNWSPINGCGSKATRTALVNGWLKTTWVGLVIGSMG